MLMLSAVLSTDPCSAAELTRRKGELPPMEAQQAYERLIAIDTFAFGSVGFAGTGSVGEQAFRTLLASPNALAAFRRILATGNTASKLYALCGIRRLCCPSFGEASTALVAANPDIETMAGCEVHREKAAVVVQRIADGAYDRWCSNGRN